MGLNIIDLPVELLELIFCYAIPENWKYYLEGKWILDLRLLCSRLFILSVHFVISQLNSSVSFRIA